MIRNNELFFLKYFKIAGNDSIDLEREKLEKAEYIARKMMEKGIPVVCAIKEESQYILLENNILYAIYPWINGKTLDEGEISPSTCYEIGKAIGKIHKLAIKDKYISLDQYNLKTFSVSGISIDPTMQNDIVFQAISVLKEYDSKQEKLIESDRKLALSKRNILCHRDMVSSNFMLYKERYYLIDWEHAGYEYPEFELLDTCLEWSDFRHDTNWVNYQQIVNGYYREVSYTGDIPYEALLDRMVLSILKRIENLLLDYSKIGDFSCVLKIKSYLFQLSELESNRHKYIDHLRPKNKEDI